MVLTESQKAVLGFVKQNQPCKAMDVMKATKARHSAVYNFLKTDYFTRSEKISGGSNNPKGGGFYYLYSINEDRKDPVVCDRIRPINIKHHPITQALFGL